MRKAPLAVRLRIPRGLPVFIRYILPFVLTAVAGSAAAAAPMFSAGLGLMTGSDAIEAASASGGSWVGNPPDHMVATQEIGAAFPMANGFAPGVFFNRTRFGGTGSGVSNLALFTMGVSLERLFARLGTAGIRAGIGRASGSAAGDEWITDIEVFMRVALLVPGVYVAVCHQFLVGAYGEAYQSSRVGVTVATPSANR